MPFPGDIKFNRTTENLGQLLWFHWMFQEEVKIEPPFIYISDQKWPFTFDQVSGWYFHFPDRAIMYIKDELYAYALSKTLTKISSPATVGLYSSCQNRINMILKQIEVQTEQETLRIERESDGRSRPRSVKLSFTGLLALTIRLIFFRPVWTMENKYQHNVRFIYVHFSAWHFAGSDLLWAGLVIRLFEAMKDNFGKFPLGLYRVVQHDEEAEIRKKQIVKNSRHVWRSKRFCCFPLWLLFLSILLAALIILILLLMFGFPKTEVETGEGVDGAIERHEAVLEAVAIAALGVPAAGIVRFIVQLGKNLIFSQDRNIRKRMDNKQISNQLGFMNEVRKEMWLLSSFLHFMEVFERRRIRVILKITNLDRCSPTKIVSVLDAMNILLSNEESHFISILAVNPEVLIEKVNFADGCCSKEDRACAILNRIVTLPFTIPPMSDESKCIVLRSLECPSKQERGTVEGKENSPVISASSLESAQETKYSTMPLLTTITAEKSKKSESSLISDSANLHKYMVDDSMSMRRIINSIRVTTLILKGLKRELPSAEHIAAWVVLVNRWPCRLSWIIQCLEDDQQLAEIDKTTVDCRIISKSKTLWEMFSEHRAELYVIREQIEDFLEQDGDPEMFETFLKVHFPFTVNEIQEFQLVTVNLDDTIKRKLGQIRGTSRLKDSEWMRNMAPLPVRTIINMSVEDVCTELERLNFPDKYANIVRSNDLSGQVLLFGNADELKLLFQMTFGDWTTFRLHFLGLSSHLYPIKKAVEVTPNHLWNQHTRAPHPSHHH